MQKKLISEHLIIQLKSIYFEETSRPICQNEVCAAWVFSVFITRWFFVNVFEVHADIKKYLGMFFLFERQSHQLIK